MKKAFNFIYCTIAFGIGVVITMLFMSACMKSVTRELNKTQHELQLAEDQRGILSDIIRCHADEEIANCDIMDVADDFLVDVKCNKDSLSNWSYCY